MALALIGQPHGVFDLAALGLGRSRLLLLALCMPLLLVTSLRREPIKARLAASLPLRTAVFFLLAASVLLFGSYGSGYNPQDFVYFKF